MQTRHIPIVAISAALVFALACGNDAGGGADTGATTAGSTAGAAADTTNHDVAFLREMSDHHEGLVAMATAAMAKGTAQDTKADAHMLHTKQQAERDSMVAMLRTTFSLAYRPSMMPSNKAMMDSVEAQSGRNYDRAFYRQVIRHHEEGIRMIDMHLPHLANAQVRAMAERMKADQKKEIEEFQGKTS